MSLRAFFAKQSPYARGLLEMEALLLTHSQGLTQSEIARRLGVDRSVIHRNLRDFEKRFPTIRYEDGRIAIDRSSFLVKVSFTLHEAMAVHLASLACSPRAWTGTVTEYIL